MIWVMFGLVDMSVIMDSLSITRVWMVSMMKQLQVACVLAPDPTTDYGTSYTWDGLFTVDEGHKGQLGQKQHFLGRIAKSTRNIRSYQMWILVNSIGIIFTLGALYTCYFHFDFFHYRLCTVYASLGHADAQHIVGERLLHGRGVEKDQGNLKTIL